jgi:hypothetical protein
MIVVGLDTASNRWHAVTDRDDSVGFCSELKNKAWDCQVKKPPKKKPKGMTADEHRAAHDAYQLALRDSLDRKRLELASAFEPWLTGLLMVDAVAVYAEEPLALQNPATTRVLSLAAGALFDRAHSVARMGQQTGLGHELHWTWIDVAHWKRVIVGNGNADKAAIRQFVLDSGSMADYEVVTYEEEPDLYDSRCLRDYGVAALSAGKRPATLK